MRPEFMPGSPRQLLGGCQSYVGWWFRKSLSLMDFRECAHATGEVLVAVAHTSRTLWTKWLHFRKLWEDSLHVNPVVVKRESLSTKSCSQNLLVESPSSKASPPALHCLVAVKVPPQLKESPLNPQFLGCTVYFCSLFSYHIPVSHTMYATDISPRNPTGLTWTKC